MKLLRVTLTGRNAGISFLPLFLSFSLVYFLLINSAGELLEKYFSNVDNARVGYLDPDIDVERAEFKFIRIIFEGEAAFHFYPFLSKI